MDEGKRELHWFETERQEIPQFLEPAGESHGNRVFGAALTGRKSPLSTSSSQPVRPDLSAGGGGRLVLSVTGMHWPSR